MGKPSSLSLSPFDLPSPGLAHFNRLVGSQSGQDKLFMVYSCAPPSPPHLDPLR